MGWEPRRKGGGRVGGGCAKRVGNGGSKGKLHKKCFIFRNRKGAKGVRGGSREGKVRKAEGLDPCLLPQNKLPLSAFHASCPLCLYPKIRSIQWCNLSETYWHSSASRFFLMKSPAST